MLRPMNGIDLASQRIQNLADPLVGTDGANKNYVDNVAKGLDWHAHARALATSNITLATPGATIDGVALTAGDRVLLNAQTTANQNGLWVWNGAAAPLTRPVDFASGAVFNKGAVTVLITEGAPGRADTAWTLSTDANVTVDTTSISFVQVGGGIQYANGNGLSLTGTTFAVVPKAGGGILVDGTGVAIDATVVARKYATALAAATAGSAQTITHNLGTLDVQATVVEVSSGQDVEPDVLRNSVNTVTVTFAAAISAGQYRIALIG